MPSNGNNYFIAIIPQKDVYDAVIAFKNDFAARFTSKKALRVMPHITLKAPFHLAPGDHDTLLTWFENLYITQTHFEIELRNFGAFNKRQNPVVYVEPIMNISLYTLHSEIIRSFKNSFPTRVHNTDVAFKPHITIAYRDLTPEKFREAWKEYKNKEYSAFFKVDCFHLLQHDTKQWHSIQTYRLK